MTTNTTHPWGWSALFGVLAASNITQLFLGASHPLGHLLQGIGFIMVALGLYGPRGCLAVSLQQLSMKIKLIGVAGVALLVIGTALQWFKI